jgi:hypothetical protein
VTVRSTTLPELWQHYDALPKEVQRRADKQFSLFIEDPLHPSLHLKPVGEFWAVRVTGACRALSVRNGNTFVWFWIGTHDEYERILNG